MASRWQRRGGWLGAGLLATFLGIQPALSAERIYFAIGPLLQSVSVASLTAFAQEGRLTGDLERYAPFIGEAQLQQFKGVLTQPYEIDPLTIGNLAYTPLGSAFLERLGNIFQTESGNNGLLAIRSALIATAQSPEGFTVLGFLQNFPTDMRLNTREALLFMQALTAFKDYRHSSLGAIATQSRQEATATPVDFSQLPDLTQPGPVPYQRQTLTVTPTTTRNPETVSPFAATLYLPQQIPGELPVVVLAPSPGDTPQSFDTLATTLASHGIAAAVPQPPGEAPIPGRTTLENHLNARLTPTEFLDRPQAISATLDTLETWDQAQTTVELNLVQVGVIGTYLGGYSALATAGAGLDRARLQGVCTADGYVLNLSLFLQCQALQLPAEAQPPNDPRIAAVVAINPLSSALLGPDSISQIDVPVLVIGSSDDLLTPVISEQVHPFIWLNRPDKVLALKVPTAQLDSASNPTADSPFLPPSFSDANTALSEQYNQALSLAFMQRYIANQTNYAPYLQAAYGPYLSQTPLTLLLVHNLTLEQLQAAYGDAPPTTALPELSRR